jgi:hypothetical protein
MCLENRKILFSFIWIDDHMATLCKVFHAADSARPPQRGYISQDHSYCGVMAFATHDLEVVENLP